MYNSELVRCLNLAFGRSYGYTYNFSNKELLNLTPDHIYAYLSFKAFGSSVRLDGDQPKQGRSNAN